MSKKKTEETTHVADVSAQYMEERVAQKLVEIEKRFSDRVDRVEKQMTEALRRCDRQTDRLQTLQEAVGQAKSATVDMTQRHNKATRQMNEAAQRISTEFEKVRTLSKNLEKRLEVIATPEAVVRPLLSQIRELAKASERMNDSVARKFEALDGNLKSWVPEYRRKGRPPQG